MDKDTLSNLKIIKELILDEQKIVTYISISKELCIHVNEAKSLLIQTVEDIRKSEPKAHIYVCYMISGLLNNNSACTTVCLEADIEVIRSTLKIIFFEHVYCVSLGVQNVDNVALTAINKLEDFSLCHGLIRASSCIKRSDDEIGNLKSRVPSIKNVSNNSSKNYIVQKPREEQTNGHEEVKAVKVKSEPIKSKTPSPKKHVSANSNKMVKKPAARGIAGFLSKPNGVANKINGTKVREEKAVSKVEVKQEKETKVEPFMTVTSVVTKKPEPGSDTSCAVKKEPTNKSQKKPTNSKLKEIKKTAKVDKKRKRVLDVSDSESETEADPFADEEKMAVDQESEDEIPPTPSVNTVKITSGIVNPKKRRKIVDKTYTDEDGYILTKKEEIYESCSDHEEDQSKVKQEKENIQQTIVAKTDTSPKANGKAKKKKVSPPQKGKQSTLTNFFKKV